MIIQPYSGRHKGKVRPFVSGIICELVGSASKLDDLDDITHAYRKFWVAEEEGSIIGTIGIRAMRGAKICRLYVSREHRGKGIGSALLGKALGYCKGKFERVYLTTNPGFNSAGFYEKMGFQAYRKGKRIWMEKMLSAPKIDDSILKAMHAAAGKGSSAKRVMTC